MSSKKAAIILRNLPVDLTFTFSNIQINWEISSNFCGVYHYVHYFIFKWLSKAVYSFHKRNITLKLIKLKAFTFSSLHPFGINHGLRTHEG